MESPIACLCRIGNVQDSFFPFIVSDDGEIPDVEIIFGWIQKVRALTGKKVGSVDFKIPDGLLDEFERYIATFGYHFGDSLGMIIQGDGKMTLRSDFAFGNQLVQAAQESMGYVGNCHS